MLKKLAMESKALKSCSRCKQARPISTLNVEATIHFGRPLECLDRKECERRKRKAQRKR